MWNFAGITLSFLGTLITLLSVLTANDKIPGTWAHLEEKLKNEPIEKCMVIIGLITLSIGYAIQAGIALLEM